MSSPTNALHDAAPLAGSASATAAVTTISPLQRLYWSVRRELWDNRSIYLAPAITGGVLLVGFLLGATRMAGRVDLHSLDPDRQRQAILMPFNLAAGLIMLSAVLVSIFYCLDALHGERRDRSILFWKSLPVSDLTTVLAKASIPLLILPAITFAVTLVTQAGLLLLSRTIIGSAPPDLWSHIPLFTMSILLLYHLFMVHSLWYAPLYGWLLLVSAWARRTPFLWAFLPPLGLCALEKIIFRSSYVAEILGRRVSGGGESVMGSGGGGIMPFDPSMHMTLGRYLSTPGLWGGLFVAAAFLAGAIQLRRYRGTL